MKVLLGFILTILLLSSCTLRPLAWQAPVKPEFEKELSLNSELENIEKINLLGTFGAEDIIFDDEGNLYCGVHSEANDFSDGMILKIRPNGQIEVYYHTYSFVSGLHFDQAGNLFALSHKEGLIKISPDREVNYLASKDEYGRPFLIPNGLDIASDGMIYFSNTSHESAYDIKYGRRLILEMKPNGGVYRYNPQTKQVQTLVDGTYFGNGVVLSQQEDYLLYTETSKYRVMRYWLRGEHRGKSEVFLDNLPGFPNGISIREDGSYWLGFTTVRNDALDKIHSKKGMKKLVFGLPEFMQPKQDLFGMVLNISQEGKILQALYDPTGVFVSEAGSVKEYKGALYLGGDVVPYISIYHLEGTGSAAKFD